MEPQSSSTGNVAAPHHRPMSDQEILELGILALDEPEQAPGIPVDNPPVVAPDPRASDSSPTVTPPPPSESMAAPEPPAPSPLPAVSSVIVPTAAQPVALAAPVPDPPAPVSAAPVPAVTVSPEIAASKGQSTAAVVGNQPATPLPPLAIVPAEQMALSANSIKLRGIAKIRTLNVFLNIVICLFAIGILIGGWYAYRYLTKSF